MAVSKRLRHEVMRRDNHACRYCGATAPDAKLTIDHVTPTTLGGSDDPGNLVTACADCNAGKSATPPDAALVADVQEGALRWAAALKRAAETRKADTDADRRLQEWFRKNWTSWFHYPTSEYTSGDEVPAEKRVHMRLDDAWGWKRSLKQWREMDAHDHGEFMLEAIRIAMTKPGLGEEETWRYFCGIMWNEIKARQKLAAQYMMEATPPTSAPRAANAEDRPYDAKMDDYYENRSDQLNFAHTEAQTAIIRKLSKLLFRGESMDSKIAGVSFDAGAEAERIFAIDLSDVAAVEKGMCELQTYVDELFRKDDIYRPPDFDFMNMADSFISDLTIAMGGDEQVVKFVHHAFWMAMPDAHAEWRRRLEQQDENYDPDEQNVDEYATEMALEHFSSSCAPYMYEIVQWRKAKDTADGT